MPLPASLRIATITGASTRHGYEGDIEVVGVSHEVCSEIDEATGLPKGARIHRVFTITKIVDLATPELHKAYIEGREFVSWVLRYIHYPQQGGKAINYATTVLDKARIVGYKLRMPLAFERETTDQPAVEEISFVYQSIAWVNPAPPKDAEPPDTWEEYKMIDDHVQFGQDWLAEGAQKILHAGLRAAKTALLDKAKAEAKEEFQKELEQVLKEHQERGRAGSP